jgi:hypothetical protein
MANSSRTKHARVLLLGETIGTGTIGLVYLAAYLRRHGVEAYCQWNDEQRTREALRANVRRMLDKIKPTLVGVSIKWFPHMARGLEIVRLVKEYDPGIQVVIGGNTASQYWREFIREPGVDFIIRGDGERPLLALCEGQRDVPNLVERDVPRDVPPEFAYKESEDTGDVYLSHLDEVFVDPDDLHRAQNAFFIYTGKRCNKKCFYCGGAALAMHETFGSARPFFRQASLVKNDLQVASARQSRILFDFDYEPSGKSQADYLEEVFPGDSVKHIDACFYFWKLPQAGTIDFLARAFRTVTISLDLASLSEAHRLRLDRDGKIGVKPQPTDEEILGVFEQSRQHPGLVLDLSLIAGMPLQEERDLDEVLGLLQKLVQYRSLGEISWGWLHAQPGSPILESYAQHGLLASATTYKDFLSYSTLNLSQKEYPTWRNLVYPLFTYKDPKMSKATLAAFQKVNALVADRKRSADGAWI